MMLNLLRFSCQRRLGGGRGRERERGRARGAALAAVFLIVHCTALLSQLPNSFAAAQGLASRDLEALREIHSSLEDLPGSSFFSSWDFSQDPCSTFDGVQCLTVNGEIRVAVLDLGMPSGGSPGLQGTLSPSLGTLTGLQQLSLVPGSVAGPIPSTIGSLYSLQFLGLSQNHFTGAIPSTISNLQSLQSLFVNGNYLSGDVPGSVGYISSLTTLSLANNQFDGQIPSFSSSWSLQHLDCSTNQFSGSIPSLPSGLNYLSLADNQLSGGLDSVSALSNLNHLDLSSNQLSGEIPQQLFSIPLQSLYLQDNSFNGKLTVTSQSGIQNVDLSSNDLSGTVPAGLGAVKELNLNNNRFSGMVPPIFASNLQNSVIQTLNVEHNYLIGLSNLLAGMTLPPQVTLCFQYNCGLAPPQSLCPSDGNSGGQQTRPLSECLAAQNWGNR